jgi:hypothetical protein
MGCQGEAGKTGFVVRKIQNPMMRILKGMITDLNKIR